MSEPINIDGILTHLRNLIEQNKLDEALQQVAALLVKMNEQNVALNLRLAKALRYQFGRRSEKVSADQLLLFVSKLAEGPGKTDPPVVPEKLPTAPDSRPAPTPKAPRKKHGRRPLPESLERRDEVIHVHGKDCFCTICGRPKSVAGKETSEILDWEPGTFFVRRIHREKLACRPCGEGIVVAPTADRVTEAGLAGVGLIAHILISKYKDSIPLHRLRGIFRRSGVDLAVSTLVGWVAQATELLTPIADEIRRLALAAYLLQTDDTGLRVLDKEHPAGIRRGHIWTYVGDARWAAFVFTNDWSSESPLSILKDRVGPILHDGYAGYEALHQGHPERPEIGCWSHGHRGFEETLTGGDSRAAVPLMLINKLFEVERLADEDRVDPAERLRRRQTYSKPILDELERWMGDILLREPPKSSLAKAIAYVVNRKDALRRFLDDPRLPLHNNLCERLLRAVAVGRKNFLFTGSEEGGKRAAIAYTIFGTCFLAGVDPWAYLTDVLAKLAAGWPASKISDLLPPNWKVAQDQAKQQPAA